MVVIVGAVGLDREHRARLDGAAVDVDGARAALAGVAADVGAGQVEVLAERLDEEPSRLDVELVGRPIDDERDVFAHGLNLLRRASVGSTGSSGCPGALRPRHRPVSGGGEAVERWWHRRARNQVGSWPRRGGRDEPRLVPAERGAAAVDRAWIEGRADARRWAVRRSAGRRRGAPSWRPRPSHGQVRQRRRGREPDTVRPAAVRSRRRSPPPRARVSGPSADSASAGSAPQTMPRSPGVRPRRGASCPDRR